MNPTTNRPPRTKHLRYENGVMLECEMETGERVVVRGWTEDPARAGLKWTFASKWSYAIYEVTLHDGRTGFFVWSRPKWWVGTQSFETMHEAVAALYR